VLQLRTGALEERTIGVAERVSAAEAVVEMLHLHGVEVVFGLCGDTSLPLYDALAQSGKIRHILCRDERSASYMADGYARASGRVGVCEGPSGGGATYILPGLVEANESSIAVLALVTDVGVGARGRYTLTEIDHAQLFRAVTKWNAVIDRAVDVPRFFRKAFTSMTTGRPGAAQLTLPFDVQRGEVESSDVWADPELGMFPARRVAPDAEHVERAAAALARAERPVLVCGGGVIVAHAEDALARVAEKAGAIVATTISGRGSIADTHPLSLGTVGSNGGTLPTRAVVEEADLVVFIGCRAGSVTTERWRFPSAETAIVHLDVDPEVIGANYRTEVAVVGDAKLALEALEAALGRTRSNRAQAEARVVRAKAEKFGAFDELAASDAVPILPERFVRELQAALPQDYVVVADPGTPCPYLSAYLRLDRTGRHYFSNRAHGALGYSLSAAVGAHVARPSAKVVSVMGDGSFGFTSGELETVARIGAPIVFVVLSNAVYGWIKAGQKHGFDERYYGVDFSETDHARIAQGYGLSTWRVTEPRELRAALQSAFRCDGPALVDVVVQPLQEARAPVSEWVA
jgi:acetolactate synthase-1/2/3 large subunit